MIKPFIGALLFLVGLCSLMDASERMDNGSDVVIVEDGKTCYVWAAPYGSNQTAKRVCS